MNEIGVISKQVKLLTGQRFTKLTVGELVGRNLSGLLLYECRCDCGETIAVTSDHLKSGNTRSCGCLAVEVKRRPRSPKLDYNSFIGQTFGKLTILSVNGVNKFNHPLAQCRCECGTLKERGLSLIITGQLKSCGCLRLEVVKKKVGPLHNNWNPNKSQEERDLYKKKHRCLEFKQWSHKIKELYNFKCQICDEHRRRLESHHLNGWAQFPDQRFDLENGVCLCKECHSLFHKKYGLKTTKEQYDEFISFLKG